MTSYPENIIVKKLIKNNFFQRFITLIFFSRTTKYCNCTIPKIHYVQALGGTTIVYSLQVYIQFYLIVFLDFCITAACTHEKEGVVAIDVHFNITGFGGENITNLQFKRTKYCEKGIFYLYSFS